MITWWGCSLGIPNGTNNGTKSILPSISVSHGNMKPYRILGEYLPSQGTFLGSIRFHQFSRQKWNRGGCHFGSRIINSTHERISDRRVIIVVMYYYFQYNSHHGDLNLSTHHHHEGNFLAKASICLYVKPMKRKLRGGTKSTKLALGFRFHHRPSSECIALGKHSIMLWC